MTHDEHTHKFKEHFDYAEVFFPCNVAARWEDYGEVVVLVVKLGDKKILPCPLSGYSSYGGPGYDVPFDEFKRHFDDARAKL